MTTRFLWALGVYAVLALLAAFTLDGNLRLAVWILLAGLRSRPDRLQSRLVASRSTLKRSAVPI